MLDTEDIESGLLQPIVTKWDHKLSEQFSSFEEAQADAEKYDCEIFLANDYVLQFDLDTDTDLTHFKDFIESTPFLSAIRNQDREVVYTRSKSGKTHAHIFLLGDGLPLEQRLIVQLCGASDRKRELFSLTRFQAQARPGKEVLLFETPTEADKVRERYLSASLRGDYWKRHEGEVVDDIPF